jgi:phage nucleotide-binding protein
MKITNTKEQAQLPIKVLVYGKPGVGKTTLAKTLTEKTLIISAEGGLLSLSGADIDVIDLLTDDSGALIPKEKRYPRLQEVYKFLLSKEAEKYKCVFIDSLTEVNQVIMDQLHIEYPDRKDSLPMFGELNKRMRAFVKSLRDLPGKSVVITALSEIDKDEDGKMYQTVTLIGKFASQLPALFDEVFLMTAVKDEEGTQKRVLITQATERLVAKDRSGKLSTIEAPDLGAIFTKIRSAVAPATVATATQLINKEKTK